MKKRLTFLSLILIALSIYGATRKPIYEIFTSDDWQICVLSAGQQYIFFQAHRDELTPIKIHTDTLDPFHTSDHQARKDFYGVSGIPDAYTDGWYHYYPEDPHLETALTQAMLKPCYIELLMDYSYYTTPNIGTLTVTIIAEQEPGSGSYKLFMGSASELVPFGSGYFTEFHYVMRDLFPTSSGIDITFSGFPDTVEVSQEFTLDTKWWNFDIDEIYLFTCLQETTSPKFVYQSENIPLDAVAVEEKPVINSPNLFYIGTTNPNPFVNITYIPVSLGNSSATLSIYDMTGRLVISFGNIYSNGNIFWDGTNNFGERVAAGIYRVELNNAENQDSKLIIKIQ